MIGIFLELQLAWGFGVRYPKGTAVQMAPPIPPPSTAIGAIAESVAIRLGLGETIRMKRKVCSTAYLFAKAARAAAFALSPESETGIIVRGELTRIFQATYLEAKYKSDPNMWFGAQAFAQAYAPNAALYMMAVFDENVLEKELKALGVEEDVGKVLREVIVRRLGSKESLVSVKRKVVGEVQEDKDVETYFYARKMKGIPSKYVTDVVLWKPTEEAFCGGVPKYEIYKVPSGPFSSQALLTPPVEKGTISNAFCLGEFCVERWEG